MRRVKTLNKKRKCGNVWENPKLKTKCVNFHSHYVSIWKAKEFAFPHSAIICTPSVVCNSILYFHFMKAFDFPFYTHSSFHLHTSNLIQSSPQKKIYFLSPEITQLTQIIISKYLTLLLRREFASVWSVSWAHQLNWKNKKNLNNMNTETRWFCSDEYRVMKIKKNVKDSKRKFNKLFG